MGLRFSTDRPSLRDKMHHADAVLPTFRPYGTFAKRLLLLSKDQHIVTSSRLASRTKSSLASRTKFRQFVLKAFECSAESFAGRR